MCFSPIDLAIAVSSPSEGLLMADGLKSASEHLHMESSDTEIRRPSGSSYDFEDTVEQMEVPDEVEDADQASRSNPEFR